jgi:hypothetical protein
VTHIRGTHTVRPAGGSPAALPTPNMCVPTGTHSQAMGGGERQYPQTSSKQPHRYLSVHGYCSASTADRLACARTPQAGRRAHHAGPPTALSHPLGLVYDQNCTSVSCHQPCESPKAAEAHTTHSPYQYVRNTQAASRSRPNAVYMSDITVIHDHCTTNLRHMQKRRARQQQLAPVSRHIV